MIERPNNHLARDRRLLTYNLAGLDDIPVQKVSLKDPAIYDEFRKKFNPIKGSGEYVIVIPDSGQRTATEALLRQHGKIR